MYEVHVLKDGYSFLNEQSEMTANGTSTLIKGKVNVVVDTMSPWDREVLTQALQNHDLTPDDIDYVVCTHGHCDHVGNNNLFTKAKQHIVGHAIHHADKYFLHPFEHDVPYQLDGSDLEVIATPGHTLDSVAVKVVTRNGVVVVAGDLFEKEADLKDEHIWKEAGSDSVEKQKESRKKVLCIADYIIPGHGPKFKVNLRIETDV